MSMKLTAFGILTFYICLNVSLFLIAETSVLPSVYAEPLETPTALVNMLVGSFLTLGLVTIVGWLFGYALLGGAAALILFVLQFFVGSSSIFHWIFYGFPNFLAYVAAASGVGAGVADMFGAILMALTSPAWLWFLITLIGGRQME